MVLAPTLLLNAGSGAAIVRPTFSRDFAGEKTLNNGTGPAIAFTRASIGTFFDANGTLQTATSDTPRFDHDPATAGNPSRGLLIEEARTNSIRNAQAGGAVIGTPGTAPTHWGLAYASDNITSAIVGTGTENGLTYVDVKYSGTPNSTGAIYPGVEASNQVAASSGQAWTFSGYIKLAGGSLSGVTTRVYVSERGSGGGELVSTGATITPTSASLASQRVSVARTFNNAGTNFAAGFFEVQYTNGVQIGGSAAGITLRIAAPQLEQGAFATSYIPTTSAAVTRSADSAVVTPISSFYNQSEGTLFAEASRTHVAKVVSFLLMLKSDESPVASFVGLESGVASPAQQRFQVSGGTGSALLGFANGVANTVYRMAGAYALNDFIGAQNGTLTSADTSGTAPATQDRMTIGMGATTAVPFYGGSQCHIRRIAYYPKRLSNALLQSLTT
jgi:hypothetical protein